MASELKKPMTKREFEAEALSLRNEARDWIDNEIAPRQAKFWRYYNGLVDKTPPPNRSAFVLTEIRDSVEATMVSLLRIFLSTVPARFIPSQMANIASAQQRTDTANFVFMVKNNGFRLLNDAFRDGLVARYGVLKTTWNPGKRVETSEYTGLGEMEFTALATDPDAEVLEAEIDNSDEEAPTFTARIKVTHNEGRIQVEGVPSEEFIIDKRAFTTDKALIVGQDGLRRSQDAINSGLVTKEQVEKWGVSSVDRAISTEVQTARTTYAPTPTIGGGGFGSDVTGASGEGDEATKLIRVSECYIRIDKDRDGVPELYRVIFLGDTVTEFEEWDVQPFSVGSPFFRPHTALGFGLGDIVQELQELSTAVSRAMLDSLYRSVSPRKWAVTGQVNMNDLARNEFDDTVRVRSNNAIGTLDTEFVGRDALQVLAWAEERKEMRTGTSKAALGLDPDALQSSTEFGVMSVFTAAQAKVESMARAFGESLVADVYDKIARLLAMHQKQEMVIRLRGNFIPVDPRQWLQPLQVESTVGIGRGSQTEKAQAMQMIVGKQEQILAQLGGENPFVTVEQYSQGLQDMLAVNNEDNPQRYMNTPEQVSAFVQQKEAEEAQNPPPPDPEMVKVQKELELKQQKQQADQQLATQKAESDSQLTAQKQQADQALAKEKAEVELQLQVQKQTFEQELALAEAQAKLRLAHLELSLETELEVLKIETPPPKAGEGELRDPLNGGGF